MDVYELLAAALARIDQLEEAILELKQNDVDHWTEIMSLRHELRLLGSSPK